MSIVFFKDDKLFHLSNGNFSLYLKIHEKGVITSPYFGRYLSEIDCEETEKIKPDWYCAYYDRSLNKEARDETLHFNSSCFLMPTDKRADARQSVLSIEGFSDDKVDFRYQSHRIYDGKPTFENMPYVRDDGTAKTLEFTLKDSCKQLYLTLSLTVFEKNDCVLRNTVLHNKSDCPLFIKRAMSLSVDFPRADFDFIHFPGEWLFERQFRRENLTEGTKSVRSSSGRSSHEENPFVMLCDKTATETYGEVFAFTHVYSGSFTAEATVAKAGTTRLTMGIDDRYFKFEVKPNESFTFPEGLTAYSGAGFEKISLGMHDLIRNCVVREQNKKAHRSILLNSWEGCYMDFDTRKITQLIRRAKKVGTELLVLDDGWFGHRNDDTKSLGDWYVNKNKIDLKAVIDECHDCGMLFGLWIEPEMGNDDSDFLQKHPDYAAVNRKTDYWLSRHQLVLNFADDKIVDTVYQMIYNILSEYDVDYVKWDNNRSYEDCFSPTLDARRQDEFQHRSVLGYYRLAKMLTEAFPNVHFHGCASGGGRFDLGTLFYFSDIWTSDENNPVQRLFIQYGTSFLYPLSVMGAHVNDCAVASYKTKAEIALFGSYGFEFDPEKLTEKDVREILAVNEIYKKYHDDVILEGDFYRLISPFDKVAFAVNAVSKDKKKALFLHVNLLKRLRAARFIKLKGLDPNLCYLNDFDNKSHKGEYYMNVGINLSTDLNEFDSLLITLETQNETF